MIVTLPNPQVQRATHGYLSKGQLSAGAEYLDSVITLYYQFLGRPGTEQWPYTTLARILFQSIPRNRGMGLLGYYSIPFAGTWVWDCQSTVPFYSKELGYRDYTHIHKL